MFWDIDRCVEYYQYATTELMYGGWIDFAYVLLVFVIIVVCINAVNAIIRRIFPGWTGSTNLICAWRRSKSRSNYMCGRSTHHNDTDIKDTDTIRIDKESIVDVEYHEVLRIGDRYFQITPIDKNNSYYIEITDSVDPSTGSILPSKSSPDQDE